MNELPAELLVDQLAWLLLGAALISAPWHTLSALCVAYLATLPFSIAAYRRVKRLRETLPSASAAQIAPESGHVDH